MTTTTLRDNTADRLVAIADKLSRAGMPADEVADATRAAFQEQEADRHYLDHLDKIEAAKPAASHDGAADEARRLAWSRAHQLTDRMDDMLAGMLADTDVTIPMKWTGGDPIYAWAWDHQTLTDILAEPGILRTEVWKLTDTEIERWLQVCLDNDLTDFIDIVTHPRWQTFTEGEG